MTVTEFEKTIGKLCDASRKRYANPYLQLEWPERLDLDQWFMSPELISIYGTETYNRLSESERRRLSFYEAVNFFSLNIHGERPLVEGLAKRLYSKGNDLISSYLHHFLDEENKHMIYFGGFCMRYAGKIYPDKKMAFPRDYAPGEEDFLFFSKILIFEEIVDVYNIRMSRDSRLDPIVRQINLMHHLDEARHLVFGRHMVKHLFDLYSSKWSTETLQGLRDYLNGYLVATWKEYYNPEVYGDAGLPDPFDLPDIAVRDPQCQAHRRSISAGCIRYLIVKGILTKEPLL